MELINSFEGKSIYLDSCLYIYFFQKHQQHFLFAYDLFQQAENKRSKIVSSTIVITELLTKPFKENQHELIEHYKRVLLGSPFLQMLNISPQIAEEAASIRANFNLKTPDAIHLATFIHSKADYFITNDKGLKNFNSKQVLILDNLKNH